MSSLVVVISLIIIGTFLVVFNRQIKNFVSKLLAYVTIRVVWFTLFFVIVLIFIIVEAQDRSFAHSYFIDIMPFEKVLASRKWHPMIKGKPIDCSYAIVSLNEDSPDYPPARWIGTVSWSETPVYLSRPTHLPDTSNPVSACAEMNAWPPDIAARLQAAVKEPGSYYYHHGETLFVYSIPQNIAARVRYGD